MIMKSVRRITEYRYNKIIGQNVSQDYSSIFPPPPSADAFSAAAMSAASFSAWSKRRVIAVLRSFEAFWKKISFALGWF